MSVVSDIIVIRGTINNAALQSVADKVQSAKQSDTLYLVLDTYGGYAGYGFRIMRLLNQHYTNIFVIVPDKAMSTGTLMALGSDKIYMYHSSTLGPLDTQIDHPSDGSQISSIDVRDTWTTISTISAVVARRAYSQAVTDFDINSREAAKIAFDFAADFVKPITNQIDPYLLHSSYRSNDVGAKYAASLLQSRMMKGKPAYKAEAVGRQLANDYETHGYAITLEEARDVLGLTVDDIANLSDWNDIKNIYDQSSSSGVQLSQVTKPKAQSKGTKKQSQANNKKGARNA